MTTTVEQRDALVFLSFVQGTSITVIVLNTGMTAVEVEWVLRREIAERDKK
jgi:hypothetical protein